MTGGKDKDLHHWPFMSFIQGYAREVSAYNKTYSAVAHGKLTAVNKRETITKDWSNDGKDATSRGANASTDAIN